MKVLYAIQGTGNGHLSRAKHIIPILQRKNIELDLLVSGIQADIQIPYEIKYRFKGLSFIFGKKGGVDVWKTYLKANTKRIQNEIKSLPVQNYDLVINDFEPISAWACKLAQVPCISFSHQAAVLSSNVPKPKKKDVLGRFILQKYAPTSKQFGLHFKSFDESIFTPIIRSDIRNAIVENGKHYTVYLPSYSDKKIMKFLSKIEQVTWQVFSKHNKTAVTAKNVSIQPIINKDFVKSLASSMGVLCGAGFETPAEALFLKKKLLVIPMKGQYEQQCNAAALKQMGVPVLKALKVKHLEKVKKWVNTNERIAVDYPEMTEEIIDLLLSPYDIPSPKDCVV